MSDETVRVVVAIFQTEEGADSILYDLEAADSAGYVGIQNAAVLRRDANNKLHIREKKDWGGGKGAAAGAVVGAIIGLVAGPGAVLVGGIGAVIGGLAAKLRDSGFDDTRLRKLGDSLKPGTSALVAAAELNDLAEVEKRLAQASAGTMTTEVLDHEIAQDMVLDGEVVYVGPGSEESIVELDS